MTQTSWMPPEMTQSVTVETYLLEGFFGSPGATGAFTSIMNQIVLASKLITSRVRRAGLVDVLGYTGGTNVQGEEVQKLDVIANETLIRQLRQRGHCAGIASEELDEPVFYEHSEGSYLVAFDPLDGSSNIDVNISIGTIFGVFKFDRKAGRKPTVEDFLQPGTKLLAAGYTIYGSSTVMVLTTGTKGVHGFTYDPTVGEFLLSHPNIRVPEQGKYYSINEGNYGRWTEPVKRWNQFIKEKDVDDGRPYGHRYVGTLVADAHRTLLRGGIFAYPSDTKSPGGKLRLLYEAAPMAMIFEAAGGAASSGTERIMDIVPDELHARTPLILGSKKDVAKFDEFMAAG